MTIILVRYFIPKNGDNASYRRQGEVFDKEGAALLESLACRPIGRPCTPPEMAANQT